MVIFLVMGGGGGATNGFAAGINIVLTTIILATGILRQGVSFAGGRSPGGGLDMYVTRHTLDVLEERRKY